MPNYKYRPTIDAAAKAVADAKSWTHPVFKLDPAALADERDKRTAEAESAYRQTMNTTRRAALEGAAKALEDTATAYSNPPTSDAGEVADRRNRWDRIQMAIDAGASLPQYIATANPADLAAIAEWGTTWARIHHAKHGTGEWAEAYGDNPVAWVHDQITARLAELDPNGAHAKAVAAVRDALDMAVTFQEPSGMGRALARHQIDGLDDTAALNTYRTSPHLKQQTAWAVGDAPADLFATPAEQTQEAMNRER